MITVESPDHSGAPRLQALVCMENSGYSVEGILHVGANDGQERAEYLNSGASPCIYVEPVDSIFQRLKRNVVGMPGHMPVKALCSDVAGDKVTFHISSNDGLSSSMLDLGDHARHHPTVTYVSSEEMITTTVDDLLDGMKLDGVPNLLVIDTQGADLKVLKGAKRTLGQVEGVFVEVSETPLYDGGCTFDEVTRFLRSVAFQLRWMQMDLVGHGDAFFARPLRDSKDLPLYGGDLARRGVATQSSQSIYSRRDDAQGPIAGLKTGNFSFHTDIEDEPWWMVDLGKVEPLQEIRVYNRLRAARNRSRTLQVHISAMVTFGIFCTIKRAKRLAASTAVRCG